MIQGIKALAVNENRCRIPTNIVAWSRCFVSIVEMLAIVGVVG